MTRRLLVSAFALTTVFATYGCDDPCRHDFADNVDDTLSREASSFPGGLVPEMHVASWLYSADNKVCRDFDGGNGGAQQQQYDVGAGPNPDAQIVLPDAAIEYDANQADQYVLDMQPDMQEPDVPIDMMPDLAPDMQEADMYIRPPCEYSEPCRDDTLPSCPYILINGNLVEDPANSGCCFDPDGVVVQVAGESVNPTDIDGLYCVDPREDNL